MDIFGPIDDIVSGAAGAAVKVVKKGAKRATDRAQDWGSQVASRAQFAKNDPLRYLGSAYAEGMRNSGGGLLRYVTYQAENLAKVMDKEQTLGQARKNIRNSLAIDAATDAIGAATGYVGGAVTRAGLRPGLRHSINAAENLLRGERVVLTSTSAPMMEIMKAPGAATVDVTTGAIKAIDPKNFYPISEYRVGMGQQATPDWHPTDIWMREERARNVGDMLNEWAQTNRYSIAPDPRNRYGFIDQVRPMGRPTLGSATVKPQNMLPYVSEVGPSSAARPAAPGVHMISPYDVRDRSFKFRRPISQNFSGEGMVENDTAWAYIQRGDRPKDIEEITIPQWNPYQYDDSLGRAAAAGLTYYQAGGVADKFFLPSGTMYKNRMALEAPLAAATGAGARRNTKALEYSVIADAIAKANKKNTKRNVR